MKNSVYSRRGDGGIHPYFLEFPPIFSETGKILHRERRKKITNVISSNFSIKIPHVFLILE
jgi:hypothetical protein